MFPLCCLLEVVPSLNASTEVGNGISGSQRCCVTASPVCTGEESCFCGMAVLAGDLSGAWRKGHVQVTLFPVSSKGFLLLSSDYNLSSAFSVS